MKKNIFINSCIAVIVLLFTYTASSKYLEHDRFIFQMRLAPVPFMHMVAPVISWVLPALELMIVAGLLFDRYKLKGLYASAVLLTIFEIYIAVMLLSGLRLPCTCGGIISQLSWKQHLIFNAVIIALSLIAIKLIKNEKNIEQSHNNDSTFRKDLLRA